MSEKWFQRLECHLSLEEWRQRSELLASMLGHLETLELDAKLMAKRAKEEIAEMVERIGTLSKAVRLHVEERDVECEWRPAQSQPMMLLVRLDTDDVIRTRPMTPEEKQAPLFSISDIPPGA